MPSILATDGYKFTMATAGWPLRQETFYYSHRRGGPHYLPFDAQELIQRMLPSAPTHEEEAWLARQGHRMAGGWYEAMRGQVQVQALPKGSWFFDREPAFSVTGPSALVSWLEPQIIQLNYRIQIATAARRDPELLARASAVVACADQADLVRETLDALNVRVPEMRVDTEGYVAGVVQRMQALVAIVEDPGRLIDVGLRTATCQAQHDLAVQACREVGVGATSSGLGAFRSGTLLTGSMGHEHVQRFRSDAAAFRAVRDRHPGPATYLLDTFSTLDSGIPAAFDLMAEAPERMDGIRYDSGDKEGQYLYACVRARNLGLNPVHVLQDGMEPAQTARFETLRGFTGVAPEHQRYGYGGYIVTPSENPLSRGRVQAVYKLSQTGPDASMKWGDESGQGKESLPGRPQLWRVYRGDGTWAGLVAQPDEDVEGEAIQLSGRDKVPRRLRFTVDEATRFNRSTDRPAQSTRTQRLVSELYALRG